MIEENKDKVVENIVNNDQISTEQSEETKEEPVTTEKVYELAKGLQKGYTLTRQEIAEMRDNLQTIADSVNKQTGADTGQDDYLTVGKLKEILSQRDESIKTNQETNRVEADKYIDATITQLRIDGVIKSKEDEDSLVKYAIAKKEPDLVKAADRWLEVKQAKEEGKKEAAKTKVRQEEGSVIGTSSKTSEEESRGLDYSKIQQMRRDWGF